MLIRSCFSIRNRRLIWLLLFLAAFGPSISSAAEIDPPVFVDGLVDTGWVGSTVCKFKPLPVLLPGRIMYTLDGSEPDRNLRNGTPTRQYTDAGIEISQSGWVTAWRVQGNNNQSVFVRRFFRRAVTPTPTAVYAGSPSFYPTLSVELKVAPTKTTPVIRFTRNGLMPDGASPAYTGSIILTKSETIRAYAIAEGYDASDPMSAVFTYLEPPPPPTVTPANQPFSTGTLTVKVVCPALAASCKWSDQPGTIDLAKDGNLLTSDSVSISGGKDGEVVYFRVQAFRTGYTPSEVTTRQYTYLPTVAAPTINPPPTTFYDTIRVQMFSVTKDAQIHYVEDNSAPTRASKDGGAKAFLLDKTVTLAAIAFKGEQPPSPIARFPFILRLTPPIPNKPSQDFVDSLVLGFTVKNPRASIFYTLNGETPVVINGKSNATQYFPGTTFAIAGKDTTIVSAIAVVDVITSTVSVNKYVKKAKVTTLTEPAFDPPGVEFRDSLPVRLSTADANAEIRYTLSKDGVEPTQQSRIADPGTPIQLDSTVQLWARAFPINGATLEPSKTRREKYTVLPATPEAYPYPLAPFANSVRVVLRTRTKKGIIHYTLNDAIRDPLTAQGYQDSVAIILSSTTVIRAVTLVDPPPNSHFSNTLTLTYEIFTSIASDTLAAGATRTLSGGYAFTNKGEAPLVAKVRTTDSLPIQGFDNISLAISLKPAKGDTVIKTLFQKPVEAPVALYRITGGKVEFVTSENRLELTQAGEYFLGADIQPPVITLVKQIPAPGGATTVHLLITDNVAGPSCEVTSPGVKSGKTDGVPDKDGLVKLLLQSPDSLEALWLRVASRDRNNVGRLPADSLGKVYLSQVWTKFVTPSIWKIGQGSVPWDLVGFPVGSAAPQNWGQIRAAHPGLVGNKYDADVGKYFLLEDSAAIGPGRAIWVASLTKVPSFNLSQFRAAESDPDGSWRIRLHPGWNMVTSPSMNRVYWPTTVEQSKVSTVTLKAPWRYTHDPKKPYVQMDSLDPWIGYFVRYYGNADIEVTVYSDPKKRPAGIAKASAGNPSAAGMDLNLEPGAGMPLHLGARTWAQDGYSIEDEPNLPAMVPAFSAWALRGQRNLMTDVVRYTPGEVLQWQVVLAPAAPGSLPELPGQVTGQLPHGYEVWAISRLRGLKFRLDPGQPLEAPTSADTLSIFAGPAEKLAANKELARAASGVDRFAFTVEKGQGAAWLRLELPWTAQVDATVWALNGKRLAAHKSGSLNSGVYRLRLERGADAQPAILRLRMRTPEGDRDYSRSVVW